MYTESHQGTVRIGDRLQIHFVEEKMYFKTILVICKPAIYMSTKIGQYLLYTLHVHVYMNSCILFDG